MSATTSAAAVLSSSNSQSDNITLAALFLSIAAFVISFFQTLIQYLTTDAQKKCLDGAIGRWARYTSYGWDFTRWRLVIDYPIVNMSVGTALRVRALSHDKGVEGLRHIRQSFARSGAGWIDRAHYKDWPSLKFYHIWHGATMLIEHGKPVTLLGLSFKCQIEWLWFLFTHPRRQYRSARASWVNLYGSLGALPHAVAIMGKERADAIPSVLDTPMQAATMHEIGLWCFVLAMKNVELDREKATINANNEFARVVTHNLKIVPGVGQVVSLIGDLEGLRKMMVQPATGSLLTVAAKANGKINYGAFAVGRWDYEPLSIIYALQRGWSNDNWHDHIRYRIAQNDKDGMEPCPGNLVWETTVWTEAKKDGNQAWEDFWKSIKVGATSSLIQTFAFLPYSNIWSGFPIRIILSQYIDSLSSQMLDWWKTDGHNLVKVSRFLNEHLINGDLPALKEENETVLASLNEISETEGGRTWLFHPSRELLVRWDIPFYTEVIGSGPLPVSHAIHRLLEGESIDVIRRDLFAQRSLNRKSYSIEAGIWFTLYLLEARLEELWCNVEKEGLHARFRKGLGMLTTPRQLDIRVMLEAKSEHDMEPVLADFLGLWIEICQRVNPMGRTADLQATMLNILGEWANDSAPCLPAIEESHPCSRVNRMPRSVSGPRSKKEFSEWANADNRIITLLNILPWLQLRTLLIYVHLMCHGDSSDVVESEFDDIRVWIA